MKKTALTLVLFCAIFTPHVANSQILTRAACYGAVDEACGGTCSDEGRQNGFDICDAEFTNADGTHPNADAARESKPKINNILKTIEKNQLEKRTR